MTQETLSITPEDKQDLRTIRKAQRRINLGIFEASMGGPVGLASILSAVEFRNALFLGGFLLTAALIKHGFEVSDKAIDKKSDALTNLTMRALRRIV